MTVEGAPHLKDEHLPVFDYANKCGKNGHALHPSHGPHPMMAAAQSFLSGAISKTINMPNEATVDDILDAYQQSWMLGLKAMALYRDGSKLQPAALGQERHRSRRDDGRGRRSRRRSQRRSPQRAGEQAAAVAKAVLERASSGRPSSAVDAASEPRFRRRGRCRSSSASSTSAHTRRRLPARRRGFTQEARVAGQKVYLRTGEYEDGSLGEIFIDMHKEGAAFRSMINCFAIAVSKGLQYGVPLEEFVDTFTFVRFEPQGMVDGPPEHQDGDLIIDYVFRVLGLEYLGRTDLVQNPDSGDPDGDDEVDRRPRRLFPNWTAPRPWPRAARRSSRRRMRRSTQKPRRSVEPIATAAVPAPVSRSCRMRRRTNGSMRTATGTTVTLPQNGNGHAHAAASATGHAGQRARCGPRRPDGRRTLLRRLRPHHRPQRRLLQVPQLRQQPRLLVGNGLLLDLQE